MLTDDTHERDLRLRNVMEREGLGPSKWRERDCITFVRAVIRELSGQEPTFNLPAWTETLGEQEVILRAPREHGAIRRGWLELLNAEPLLRRVNKGELPRPGMIGLTPAKGFGVDQVVAPARGPLIGVVGPDCAFWTRMHDGLKRAYPIVDYWEVIV